MPYLDLTMTSATATQTQTDVQYHWNWNDKLNASPFRQEIKRLKQDSKANPQRKSKNNQFKRDLRCKEKELLVEFQLKCDQAKIWINNAHREYADEETEDPTKTSNGMDILERIAYQKKKEKIDTIDQFWEELLCKETVFVQNHKMEQQTQEMAALERQLKEAQAKLDLLNAKKDAIDGDEALSSLNGKKRTTNGVSIDTDSKTEQIPKREASPKKKKRNDKEDYKGLVGFFNRPQKKKKKKVHSGNDTKSASETIPEVPIHSESISMSTNHDENAMKESNIASKPIEEDTDDMKDVVDVYSEKEKSKESEKKGSKKSARSMKGGFLNSGTKLYDDKKSKEDMTVDELNAKNRRQIEEMGLKEATENPFFSWERPKMKDRKDMPDDGGDNPNPFEFLNKLNIQSNQK